jgi:hypothetical protein
MSMSQNVTKIEVDELLSQAKEAVRQTVLNWQNNSRYDEDVVTVGGNAIQFILSLNRNPFEMKAHFRTKLRNIQIARIDDQRQHLNPDGERIVGPHLHWFKEGYTHLEWAEAITWYDIIKTRFPYGIQEDWI